MEPMQCTASRTTVNEFLHELNELRERNIFCDVNIIVEDEAIPCHRNVLSSASHYFRAMFTREFQENTKVDVKLPNVEGSVFRQILNFMYLGTIVINEENVNNMLIMSEYLGLKYVEDLCLLYIDKNISMNNIGALLEFAVRTGKQRLSDMLYQFIAENFIRFAQSDELLQVSSECITNILNHPSLCSNVNLSKTHLSNWFETQPDLVRKLIGNLSFNCLVDVITKDYEHQSTNSEMDEYQFDTIIEPVSHKKRNPRVKPYLRLITSEYKQIKGASLQYRLTMHSVNEQGRIEFAKQLTSETTDRFTQCKSFVLDGQIMYSYLRNKKWAKIFSMNLSGCCRGCWTVVNPAYHFTDIIAVSINNTIFFYDYNSTQQEGRLVSFDCDEERFKQHALGQKHVSVDQPSMVARDDDIYIIGGRYNNRSHWETGGLAQHHDFRTTECNRLPNSLFQHINARACIHNDKIYVMGGDHLSSWKKVAEVFDPVAGKWEALSPMPEKKLDYVLTPFKKYIYAIGGSTKIGEGPTERRYDLSINIFKPVTNTWVNRLTVDNKSTDGFFIHDIVDAVIY